MFLTAVFCVIHAGSYAKFHDFAHVLSGYWNLSECWKLPTGIFIFPDFGALKIPKSQCAQ
jgi:hypothetical protein